MAMLRHANVYLKKSKKGQEFFVLVPTPDGKQLLSSLGGDVYINMFPDAAKIKATRDTQKYGEGSVGFAFFNKPEKKADAGEGGYKKPYNKPAPPVTDVPF